MTLGTTGADLVDTRAVFACAAASSFALASSSRRVGGNGGSLAWSSVGGNFRAGWPSPEAKLVADDMCFSERADAVDMYDISESLDPLLPDEYCVDGRRGGSSGETCWVEFREGSGGTSVRLGSGGDGCSLSSAAMVVLRGNAGGFSFDGRAGTVGLL